MAESLLSGRYRLREQLDAGGMAEVWRGHDEVLDRAVAIKLPGSALAADPEFMTRLRMEAQAAARLSHPCIVKVYDYGEQSTPDGSPQPFVVMELVDGATLDTRISGGRRLPWREAVTICAEVAMALSEAHEHGLVHRDVTAANVMVTPAGAKVLDFGISAWSGEREKTESGLLGTPAYVAPERLTDNDVTPAVDVYAIGILLYRCLAGRYPWIVGLPVEHLKAHLRLAPDPLPPIAGLPSEVVEWCMRCLAKDPAERPSSAELARALGEAVGIHTFPQPDVESRTAAMTTSMLPPITKTRWPRRVALTASAVGLAMLAWFYQPATPRAVGEALTCQVTFRLIKDDARTFESQLALQSGHKLGDWTLQFQWPGRQQLTSASGVQWAQSGQSVQLRGKGTPQIKLIGRYAGDNALPTAFSLLGTACATTVVGTAQQPAVDDDDDDDDKPNGKKPKKKRD